MCACLPVCLPVWCICICQYYAYAPVEIRGRTLGILMYPILPYSLEKGLLLKLELGGQSASPSNPPVSAPPPKSSTVVGLQMHMGILVFEMDAGNFNSYSYSYITHWTATLASFCLFLKISHLEQDRNSTFICHCNQKSSFTCPKSRYLGCNLASFTSWISYLCQWLLCRL